MSIETQKIKDENCRCCKGQGVLHKQSFINGRYMQRFEKCKTCDGTGKYTEHYSYYIDDEQKIAFSSEPGK